MRRFTLALLALALAACGSTAPDPIETTGLWRLEATAPNPDGAPCTIWAEVTLIGTADAFSGEGTGTFQVPPVGPPPVVGVRVIGDGEVIRVTPEAGDVIDLRTDATRRGWIRGTWRCADGAELGGWSLVAFY